MSNLDFSLSRLFKFNERIALKLTAESFNPINHPNYQQSTIDNVQYSTTQSSDSTGNPLPVWTATPNPEFRATLAVVPRFGSRSFQVSARIEF